MSKVIVKAGQRVRTGQVLARLDPTDALSGVREAEATLVSARANLATALAGESQQQRKVDSVSLAQGRASIAQARTSVRNALAQLRSDQATTRQAVVSALGSATLSQGRKQLRADQGNLGAAVAKLNADKAKLTVNGTTYSSADEAVNAFTNIVNQDKAKVQADTQTNYDLQTQQTIHQQALSSDQTSLQNASRSDQAYWRARVSEDQNTVNADALRLAQMAKQLNAEQYQLTQDESTLQTLQTLQSTITQDLSTIQSYESKIVADRNSIATATSTRDSQVQSAQNARSSTIAKDRQTIVTARQQVSSALLALRSTAANNTAKSTPTAASLAQDNGAVLQAEVGLQTARRTLSQTVLRAPVSGTVSSVSGTLGQSVSGGGTTANSSSSSSGSTSTTSSSSNSSGFVTLVDLQALEVTSSFSESDAAKIRVGQPATITVSALPGKQLAAHVIAVNTTGTSSSGVVQYSATLALDRTVAGLKPGMTVNTTVTTGERDNVLNVPNAAVSGSGANASVRVLTNGTQRTVSVVVGLKGDSTTVIVSGLRAGQLVVTSSGATSTGTGTTGTAGRQGGFPGAGLGVGPPGG